MAEIVKRIGPAGYWCRRCAHCNSIKLGCIDDVPIYTCSTYDGVEKEIPGDENITCTMFKLANEVPVYELKNKKTEQMAREKQKELEDKVDKYEDILVDICDALDPHFDFDKYDDDMEAFENFPSRILDLKRSCKDNFDECIRKMDIIDELKAENAKLKEEIKALKSDIDGNEKEPCTKISLLQHELEMDKLRRIIHQLEKEKVAHMKGIERLKNQVKNLQITNEESYKREEKLEDKVHKLERRLQEEKKRFDRVNIELLIPLARVLYPREAKNYKPYSEVINDIKDLKVYSEANETRYEDLKYWKERCRNAESDVTTLNSKVEVLDKRNTNQSVIIGEKGKEIENLTKKNRELQIRVNDLLFQEKLNKSAFGYDFEEENGKLRVENERLRNMVKSQRNCSSSYYYSALKAEDKIEHIQKEAKKWKNKYKEAYDILQEFFGEHSNISSVSYNLSGDYLTLKLTYNVKINHTKYKSLENARERMKKLD